MNRKKLILFIAFLITSNFIWAQTQPDGWTDGSGGEISSLSNLRWLSETPEAWDEDWVLTTNISAGASGNWNSGKGFSPIGLSGDSFTGTFNGQGYTISNLTMDRSEYQDDGSHKNIGLFGIMHGTVKNLKLTNVDIKGGRSVGALAGGAYGTIDSCSVSGTVVAEGTGSSGGSVGGLVGSATNCNIKNSSSAVEVTAEYTGAGGLVGNMNGGNIENCYASGSVTSTANRVGGLVGLNSASIKNCRATGDVDGYEREIGGLIGYNFGSVELCSASGRVRATTLEEVSSGGGIGGLIGTHAGSSDNIKVISKSYATGEVKHDVMLEYFYVGGFVGEAWSVIIRECYATGNVRGRKSTGGFVGRNGSNSHITNCFSINGMVETNIVAAGFAGGNSGQIDTCYTRSQIIDMTSDNSATLCGFGFGSDNNNNYCYYDEDVANHNALAVSSFGVPRYTSEFAQENKMYGFDFEETWTILTIDSISTVAMPHLNWYAFSTKITLENTNEGAGEISGGGFFNVGDNVELTATPNSGYAFDHWSVNGDTLSTENPYSFTLEEEGDLLVKAHFKIDLPFAGGDGTEENPYQITSIENFNLFNEFPMLYSKHFVLVNDIDATGTSSWNNDAGFEAIGYYGDEPFSGVFDGQGYAINGLTINRSGSFQALFSETENAIIKNLRLENVDITGYKATAALIGKSVNTLIDSCFVSGTVYAEDTLAGGLVALLDKDSKILFSGSSANVTANKEKAGGLVGRNHGTIKYSHSSGTILVTAEYGSTKEIGGLVAINKGNIETSYSTASVEAGYDIGGLVGHNYGDITNCFAAGEIDKTGGYAFAGGIACEHNSGTIRNCYSTATFSYDDEMHGGIVGIKESGAYTYDCYFDNEVSNTTEGAGNGSSWGATGLTTAEFADAANFTNWDFENIWEIATDDAIDANARPYFLAPTFYKAQFTAGQHGTVIGDTLQNVLVGGDAAEVTAQSDPGYDFVGWANTTGAIVSTDSVFIAENITQDTLLKATFAKFYTVELNAGDHGNFYDGNKTKTFEVASGDSTEAVQVYPSYSYEFREWVINDSIAFSTENPLVIHNVDSNMVIKALYDEIVTLSFSYSSNGYITGETSQQVAVGKQSSEVIAIPNNGYGFLHWKSADTIYSTNDTLVVTAIEDASFTAYFEENFTVKFVAGENGYFEGDTDTLNFTLLKGANSDTIEVFANDGYRFVEWVVNDTLNLGSDNPIFIDSVHYNMVVVANYEVVQNVSGHLASEVKLYPNPANETLNIKTNEQAEVQIFNALGRLVMQTSNVNKNASLDIGHLEKGMYYIQLKMASGNKTLRFVKN